MATTKLQTSDRVHGASQSFNAPLLASGTQLARSITSNEQNLQNILNSPETCKQVHQGDGDRRSENPLYHKISPKNLITSLSPNSKQIYPQLSQVHQQINHANLSSNAASLPANNLGTLSAGNNMTLDNTQSLIQNPVTPLTSYSKEITPCIPQANEQMNTANLQSISNAAPFTLPANNIGTLSADGNLNVNVGESLVKKRVTSSLPPDSKQICLTETDNKITRANLSSALNTVSPAITGNTGSLTTSTGKTPDFQVPSSSQIRSQNQNLTLIDKDKKEFVCPQCNKSFSSKSLLDRHMPKHTGERKFSCKHCYKRFTSQGARDNHMKNKHRANTSSNN